MFTREELINKLYDGAEGRLQLPYEEACTLQKILISQGYVVLMADGDIGDKYEVKWVYAGDTDYANPNQIVFASTDYLDMLVWGDYKDEDEEEQKDFTEEKKVRFTKADGLIRDYTEEPLCNDCIYYDDIVKHPKCDTCKHNYPNNCVVK